MKRVTDSTGKSLFKAIYKLKAIDQESQRFVICNNRKEARAEVVSYDVEYFTLDLIQKDISIVILKEDDKNDKTD